MRTFDVVVIGGGILGVCVSYVASCLGFRVCVLERESDVAQHSSSRNTGVVHRPFYLNPETKRIFAIAAQRSYSPLQEICNAFHLPWCQNGTLEVATKEEQVEKLKQYAIWAKQNGMNEQEFEIVYQSELGKMEEGVKGYGAFYSKKDTNTDFGQITKSIAKISQRLGTTFLFNTQAISISCGVVKTQASELKGFVINVAGGEALRLAQTEGVAHKFAQLHFRGDYWVLHEKIAKSFKRNIYTVPRYSKFPFLDPHIIKRPNGNTEIGPNAFLVRTPYSYKGTLSALFANALGSGSGSVSKSLKLFLNREFLSLVASDWLTSISKRYIAKRVSAFAPALSHKHFVGRGVSGIRHNLIDQNGFVPEAVLIQTENSFHVLNYNSPGATGSAWFAASIVKRLVNTGFLNAKKGVTPPFWKSLIEEDEGWKELRVIFKNLR